MRGASPGADHVGDAQGEDGEAGGGGRWPPSATPRARMAKLVALTTVHGARAGKTGGVAIAWLNVLIVVCEREARQDSILMSARRMLSQSKKRRAIFR